VKTYKRSAMWIIFLIVICLFANTAAAKVVERIAAIVNNEIILLSELEMAAQSWRSMLIGIRNPEEKLSKQREINMKVLNTLIEDKLLEQQIEELKVDVGEKEVDEAINRVMRQNKVPDLATLKMALSRQGIKWDDYKDEVRRQLRKWKFINAKFSSRVKISDEEIEAEFEKQKVKKEQKFEYRASHILFRSIEEDSQEMQEAKVAKAEAILSRIRSGEDFAKLAREFSEGPTSKYAGDLGYFREGVMVESFENAVKMLKVGEITDVVRTPFGLHIIKLTDKRAVESESEDNVRNEIRAKLREDAMKREMAVWLNQIRNKAYIDIKIEQPEKQLTN